MKPKITVLISLLEDGKVTMQTTSGNHIATLGLLSAAVGIVHHQLTSAQKSDIIVPEMVTP